MFDKPELKKQLEILFTQVKFEVFLESLVENPLFKELMDRPLKIILSQDGQDFRPWEWLDWMDGSSALAFETIPETVTSLLDQLKEEELFVLYRWLLDKSLRIYGPGKKKQGRRAALELINEVIQRLSGSLPARALAPLLEACLPLAADPALASDLYHWLFVETFQPSQVMEPLFYALRGLDLAKQSQDRERIAWSYYNLAHYYTYFDGEEAETKLDEAIDYLRDERYFDILGNIAMKHLDAGKTDRARAYLQTVYQFLKRTETRGELLDLDTIAFNLAYFSLSLAWIAFDDSEYEKCREIGDYLLGLLVRGKQGFLSLGEDLGSDVTDWKYQYYAYTAEAFLWTYTARLKLGLETEARGVADDLKSFVKSCPYDLNPLLEEFCGETRIEFPWKS